MFAKALLVGAFAALAVAQSSVLTFTRVPNPVTAGEQQALTYATNDTASPVTIVLRKGASGNLETIANLTTTATGGQYIWTPEDTLENGSDYALEIIQGTQINYFGPFSLQGAGRAVTSSTITSMPNNTMTMTGTAASMGTGMSMPRNTTMSMATLSSSSMSESTAPSTTASQSTSRTSAAAPTNSTGAASSFAAGSSTVALIFGAIAAILYC